MKTYQEFIIEAYSRYGRRPLVRGKDYEDYKNLPSLDFRKFRENPDPKKERRKETAKRMDAAGKKLGLDEAGDWWHPDPKQDRLMPGRGPKLRAREDRVKEQDHSKKLKPGETYMQFAKRKQSERMKKEECDLSETSLTRVMSKSQKGGMAIMSAQRGDKSKAANKARSKQLEKDIRGAGLPGPTKVSGRYTENPGTPQEKKVGEKSHIITPGKKGKRKFKKAIEKLGKKYNQDSVLIQRKKGGEATLKGTSKTSWPGQGKNVKIGSMKPGRTGEFDTKVKNKTFTVEN